jgi:hypothetical protein
MDAICESQGTLFDQVASEEGGEGVCGGGTVYFMCGDYLWCFAWAPALMERPGGGKRRDGFVPMNTL